MSNKRLIGIVTPSMGAHWERSYQTLTEMSRIRPFFAHDNCDCSTTTPNIFTILNPASLFQSNFPRFFGILAVFLRNLHPHSHFRALKNADYNIHPTSNDISHPHPEYHSAGNLQLFFAYQLLPRPGWIKLSDLCKGPHPSG